MADRLAALDASFLYAESPTLPMHVGTVAVFTAGGDGFGYEDLVALVRSRLGRVPRFRQKVRPVPAGLAGPVWVDDADFDVTYHVRRSALPRPGDDEQLCELAARLMSRPLDRARPLWELYLVEGLLGDRFALISKTHLAMVDGVRAVDLAEVLLDPRPGAGDDAGTSPPWLPEPEPSDGELVRDAMADVVRRPTRALATVRAASGDLATTAGRVLTTAFSAAGTLAAALRPGPSTLTVSTSAHRRFAVTDIDLDGFRTIRSRLGGTVNDAILTTLTLALRSWLLARGEAVTATSTLRALVPVSVHDPGTGADDQSPDTSPGRTHARAHVRAHSVDLPIGEPNAVVCLQQVSYGMRAHTDDEHGVDARSLVGLAGFAPSTLHSLGTRVAAGLSRRLYHTVVTNVPGPQRPLYANDALLVAAYPVVPLVPGQALSIGLTSYAGRVYFGFTGDRGSLTDVADLVPAVLDSRAHLLAAATATETTDTGTTETVA